MSTRRGPKTETSGLILCLDAANTKSYVSGSSIWTDISRNGNSGSLVNTPTFVSSSILMDGVNEYVDITTIDFRQTFTLECWVNMATVNNFAFFGQGTPSNSLGLHIQNVGTTGVKFGMFGNDTEVTTLTTAANTWYHYAFTYNHNSPYGKQLFRNGQKLNGTEQQTQSQYAGTGNFRIGATYSSGGSYGNGQFGMVKMYNRILTNAEVLQSYTSFKSRYGL